MTVHLRQFPTHIAGLTDADAKGRRHLTGRLVPYDADTLVVDDVPNGEPDIYREGFRRSAFEPQLQPAMAKRVGFVHTHGGTNYLGTFERLWHGDDGLYGDIAINRSKTTDVEDFLQDGIDNLSVEFRLPKGDHTLLDGGVRWRVNAHLENVALVAKGAYPQAQVLQLRAAAEEQEALAAKERAEADEVRRLEQLRQAEADAAAELRRAEVQAAADRRARLQSMAERIADDQARQADYYRKYGVTIPGRSGR